MAENTKINVAEAAALPKRYENDGEVVQQHSLPELVAADKYLSKKKASGNPFSALRGARILNAEARR